MAGEIHYSLNVSLVNGVLKDSYNTSSLAADQAAAGLVRNVMSVATTAAGVQIDLGSVTSPRLAVFYNLDTTNYIEIGLQISGTFYPFLKLKAGEQAGPMFLGTNSVWARSNTAPVKLFYIIYEG